MNIVSRIGVCILGALFISTSSYSQVIGGRENGEMTPTTAEASKLSGGSFKGDVNPMTGEFNSNVTLGSVATPGGLGFNLSLDYSSSFSLSSTQAMTSGIPYGEGWGPNVPTLSVEVDAFHKFTCTDLNYLPTQPDALYNNDTTSQYQGRDEGDLYWFSPIVNIPGIVSGRAVFKYIDQADDRCLVFALNKFETGVEIRFYGSKGWEVRVSNGDTYTFRTQLKSYAAPDAQRVLHYDASTPNINNQQQEVVINSDQSGAFPYGTYSDAVQNVVEPKQSFTVWYCNQVFNPNTPKQSINFQYNTYGAFNYYQEYEQEHYDLVRSEIFGSGINTNDTVYTDIHLARVYSAVDATPVDIIELNYTTTDRDIDNNLIVDGSTILDKNDSDVFAKDSLYNYTIVESWGANTGQNSFNGVLGWRRYKHAATQSYGATVGGVSPTNPYLNPSYNLYQSEDIQTSNHAAFDHGFLESERLFSNGTGYYPGDIYEIRTEITRPSSFSTDNGNGTIDIAVVSGTHGNTPGYTAQGGAPSHQYSMNTATYESRKGVEIFSTFGTPLKWQMGHGQGSMTTSNLFVMPNIPSSYFGFNIQIGPGNSDLDYSIDGSTNTDLVDPLNGYQVDAREGYPYQLGGSTLRSTDRVPHNFGTGHPWAMMIPIYNEIALNRSNLLGSASQPFELYETWWSPDTYTGNPNIPTKFDDDVKLQQVELIRYSKNPYMLDSVIVYKVSGEFKGLQDSEKQAWNVVSKKKMHYSVKNETLLRNYDYENGDALEQESIFRKVILLAKVSEAPVNADLTLADFGLTNPTQVLTTTLEYSKYLDGAGYTNPIYTDTTQVVPYLQAMNQYVLTSYIDALGGITRVEFYPFDDAATRLQSNYNYSNCNFQYAEAGGRTPFGTDQSFSVHPAVRFLSKNDETDGLLNTSTVLVGGNVDPNLKVWEYVYETSDLMIAPSKISLPQEHFFSNFYQGYEMAFKRSRVYEPYVDPMALGRNYTDYEYYGDSSSDTTLTINEYLFYGKPKHIKRYSYNNVLEEETIFQYDYTLAFENGYLRPNPLRERLWNEHPVLHEYEYQDIQENDTLEVDVTLYNRIYDTVSGQWLIIDSTVLIDVSGTDAYSYLDVPYANGKYTDREMPKFLDLYFFEAIDAINDRFMLNSYFIKKTAEIHRTYDDYLGKGTSTTAPGTGVISMPAPNPYGSGYINTVGDDPKVDDVLIQYILPGKEEQMIDKLKDASPLSEAVLTEVVISEVHGSAKFDVLKEQGNLSNNIWGLVWEHLSSFSPSHVEELAHSQTYLSDQVIMDMIDGINKTSNASLVETVLTKHDYLSGQVINDILNAESTFPGNSFANTFAHQPQLPESDLLNILANSNTQSWNVMTVLSNQFVTDDIYVEMLENSKFKNESVTKVIEVNNNFPVDLTLNRIIDHVPAFSVNQLTRIFAEADRLVGNEVYYNLIELGPEFDNIIAPPLLSNSLSQYCNNNVQTGRTYIETKTEYEYYEADQTGKALGVAYEVLLGMRENFEAQSRLPYTVNPTTHGLTGGSFIVDAIQLKHEPSWMPFSVTTSSPHLEGAYKREEFFYNYDLLNRYDRHWYNYDYDNGNANYTPNEYLVGSDFSRILVSHDLWPLYYNTGLYDVPEVPAFDAMSRNQQLGNRSLAFQKTNISKNTRDTEPKFASEYFFYNKGWVVPGYPGATETVQFTADTCLSQPSNGGNCPTYVDCNDCYSVFYKPFMSWEEIVPMGYCAWHVQGLGYIVCPQGHNPENDFPAGTVTFQHCEDDPTSGGVGTLTVPYSETFTNMVQLRSVFVQVDDQDHSVSQEFANSKLDGNNTYVAEFSMGVPSFGQVTPHDMILPSDHLKVREIHERNRYTQVALEENSAGLQTKYHYNETVYIRNVDPSCPLADYGSRLNEDIGLPTKVEVGYGRADSLVTKFQYNEIGLVEHTLDPNGKTMQYEFDDYYRLTRVIEDSTRLLSENEYHSWDLDELSSFDDRTDSNYVQTKTYNDSISNRYELSKAFLDPLGRNQGSVISYTTDGQNHNAIHSGFVSYDNLGRVIQTEKTYTSSYFTPTVGDPVLPKSQAFGGVVEQALFESGYKGRPTESSNFGVSIQSNNTIRTNYNITNNVFASCELDLNLNELYLVMRPGGTTNVRLFRSEVFDQDDKQSVSYKNAFGQDVATLRYNDNNEKIVTLFGYDSYGNLTKTINPEKQATDYIYNRLGQLVIENTVDAGAKHFMYNKQGLISIILDDQGRTNMNGTMPDPFYRVMEYDIYGRMTTQGRSDISGENHSFYYYNDSMLYGPLYYKTDTLVASIDTIDVNTFLVRSFTYEFTDAQTQDYLYNYTLQAQSPTEGLTAGEMDVDYREKTIDYGVSQSNISELGRIRQTTSYNESDQPIQLNNYEYDLIGNISSQTIEFNPIDLFQSGASQYTIISEIEYPGYNYRRSLTEQTVDVDGDNVIDYHCFMQYDPLNRLTGIYGAVGEVNNLQEATLLVSYEYDDVTGKMSKRRHSIDAGNQALFAIANEIEYNYDNRDRLTNITSGLMNYGFAPMLDYSMYYDDQVVDFAYNSFASSVSYDNNWNGNINGIQASYNFDASNVVNNVQGFDGPTVYGYDYDAINRLIAADGIVGDQLDANNLNDSYKIGDVTLSYDRIGNIQTLQRFLRNTDLSAGAPYTIVQDFSYTYATDQNRLLSAVGGNANTSTRNYTYDVIGNVLTDNYRNIVGTEYGRGAYAFELTIDPDGIPANADDEAISYLYSSNDLRIYKKRVTSTGTLEDYYLMDASGRTVAILKTGYADDGWNFFVNGAEREARIFPTQEQTPGANATATLEQKQIGRDNATFYVNDHLGNTRITYTPVVFVDQPNESTVYQSDFTTNTSGWSTGATSISFANDDLTATTVAGNGFDFVQRSLGALNVGQTYTLNFYADLGTTPNLRVSVLGSTLNNQVVQQGMNYLSFIYNGGATAELNFQNVGGSWNPPSYTYTIDDMFIGQLAGFYTQNRVEYVGDYFPYGKILREYVDDEQERYLTTQHERDVETGLDYRGARYYDSDVARFLSTDPWENKYPEWSTYNYVMGNPIILIDPNGKGPIHPSSVMNWMTDLGGLKRLVGGTVNNVTIVGTGIVMPIARVIAEEASGKLRPDIAPYSFDSDKFEFVSRADWAGEISPEDGAEIMNATVGTVSMITPVKQGFIFKSEGGMFTRASLLTRAETMGYKTIIKEGVKYTLDEWVEAGQKNQANRNIQEIGNSGIKFDSNTVRKSKSGTIIATDINTGKDYGVVRDSSTGKWNFKR